MYKYPFLFCSLLFGIISCTAQTNKSPKTGLKATKDVMSLTWKVSGNGLEEASYLLGTIHIICKDDYFWTEAMEHALEQSQKVCMEMDLDDPSLQMELSQGLLLPPGKTLKDYFSESDYQQVSAYVQDSLGMPMIIMDKMKPIALLTMMSTRNMGSCDATESYEMNIMKKATEGDKELIGLETPAEQLATLEKLNTDSVADYVMKSINDGGQENSELLKQLTDAYKRQDLAALYQLIIQSQEYSADLDGLLFQRNAKWIPLMAGIMKKQPTLFAVGAGHLWGEKGVIELLRDEGYTVEPYTD